MLESRFAIKYNNNSAYLSPQELVDCSTANSGCNGGWFPNAFDDVIKFGGLHLDVYYPYTAVKGWCSNPRATRYAKPINNIYTQYKSEVDLMNGIALGPVAVAIDASSTGF